MSLSSHTTILQALHETPLFSALASEELNTLTTHVSFKHYPSGARIFEEGVQADGFHIVLRGKVKIFHINPEGKEIVLHIVKSKHTFGEAAVFQEGTYPAAATALQEVETLFIAAKPFLAFIRQNPTLALRLLAALSLRLRMFTRKLEVHGNSATQRLASYLLHRAHIHGNVQEIHLENSREVLANMLGLARETLSRNLRLLENNGYVRIEKRLITILDPTALQAIASGDKQIVQ